jgi:CRISPR-associated protein Cas2
MSGSLYLVSYDIVDDRRRNKLAKILQGYGNRVQYSVFECRLSKSQAKELELKARPYVKIDKGDSLRLYILCKSCEAEVVKLEKEAKADRDFLVA